jgi:DNA-binding PadR family transcriptional regulator
MLLAMTERANPKPPQPSPLGLIVLWQLWSEPMHVYRLQKLLEAEGKDRIVNVRSRASLYQTIERLERLGLVEVSATVRQEGYPDRVVYAVTDAGRLLARQWLREMLSDVGGQYPEFIVALSILFALPV